MKINKCWIVVIVVLLLSSCGGPKNLVSHKDNAISAAELGNYKEAVEAWKIYFNTTKIEETDGASFVKAAGSAFKSGNLDLALSWFDQARYKTYSDAEMYAALAKIYREKNNISKEMSALEFYTENFGKKSNEINNRLFEVYSEIKLNEKALMVWKDLNETSKNDLANLERYFLANKDLENTVICDSVSVLILEKNPKQIEALKWNAKKYYWLGQNRYNSEMEKYNNKKTTRQYSILLKELDLVTADFKKSLPYLKTLWDLEPGKEYASYLANIYARFGDEKKANYYKKLMK